MFQSTRPVRGATDKLDVLRRNYEVSIHAPRAGRDYVSIAPSQKGCRFNPRAPCGARLMQMVNASEDDLFQSTRPVRGATTEPRFRVHFS